MVYLTDNDIKKVCADEDLAILEETGISSKDNAEGASIALFKGYLRGRYDVADIFTQWDEQGEDPRDAALVMFLADYMLYVLYASQPDRLIPENRVDRKDEALNWLKGIQKGEIIPDFKLLTDADGEEIHPIKTGYNTRVSSNW